MPYQVTRSLETGNAMIDQEHEEMFAAINRLLEACRGGKESTELDEILQSVKSYTEKHLADEEALQLQSSYPEYSAHQRSHEVYKNTVEELCEKIRSNGPAGDSVREVNTFLAGGFVAHIRNEDKKFAVYLEKHS